MDAEHFDRMTRAVSGGQSRRAVLTALLGGTLGYLVPHREGSAKKKGGKSKSGKGKSSKGKGKKKGKCPNQKICAGACIPLSACCTDFECPEGEQCIDRSCRACSEGYKLCGSLCVETTANREHCGNCNNVCPENMRCEGGTCICDGPICSVPDGSSPFRCCPAPGGVCCNSGRCCLPGGECRDNLMCEYP